jgi:hypothetical protein
LPHSKTMLQLCGMQSFEVFLLTGCVPAVTRCSYSLHTLVKVSSTRVKDQGKLGCYLVSHQGLNGALHGPRHTCADADSDVYLASLAAVADQQLSACGQALGE